MNSTLKTLTVMVIAATLLPCESLRAKDAAECGFQVGGNIARFDGNPFYENSEFRLRFGLFASARLMGNISYQAELNYVQKGGFGQSVYVNNLYDSTWFDVEVQLDYIEAPLLIKAELAPKSQIRPVLTGGAYIAWVIEKHYLREHYQPANSDLGLLFGFGFEPIIHGRTFILETRYAVGLKKIIDDPVGNRLTNRTLSFTLGVGL